MLYAKIVLALALTAIPFLFKYLILPKKDNSVAYRNAFGAIWSTKSFMAKYRKKYFNISIKIYNALKQSREARKFFSLILLLLILTVVMVDLNASASVARKVNKAAQECAYQTDKLVELYTEYRPYITFRYATLLAGLMVIPFFSFKATDRIMVWLQGNKAFLMTSITTLLLLIYSTIFSAGRSIVVIELIYIILGASIIYPSTRRNRTRTSAWAVPKDIVDKLYRQRYEQYLLHNNKQ